MDDSLLVQATQSSRRELTPKTNVLREVWKNSQCDEMNGKRKCAKA